MPLQSNSSWRCVSRHSRKRINDKRCLVHHFRYCELPRSCRCSSANSHKFTKVRKSDSSLRHKRCFSAAACCFSAGRSCGSCPLSTAAIISTSFNAPRWLASNKMRPIRGSTGKLAICLPRGNSSPLSFTRSEEHTSELQSRPHLVCRLLLEKKQ